MNAGEPETLSAVTSASIRPPVVASYCATFLRPEMFHIYRQIAALRRFRPVVLTQKRAEFERFPFPDITVLPRSRWRFLWRFWHRQLRREPVRLPPGETRATLRALETSGAALLHVYFGHIAVELLPLLARWHPRPAVVSFHGADVLVDLDKPAYRRAVQEMLGRVNLVLARSRSLLEALGKLGCPPEKLRLQRTGIPLAEFPFRARTFPPPDGRWRLLQACRLIPKKGLLTTLRAFAEFARAWPEATLTVAGEGPMAGELQALATELGVGGRVRFPGFLSQDALKDELYSAHVFLHPSELGADGNQEGVPNSVLEAMATGLPVVATTHGGIPEAIEHGVSGLLVPERDPVALAGALRELVTAPTRLHEMAENAAVVVGREFEQSARVSCLEAIYEEALAMKPLSPLR